MPKTEDTRSRDATARQLREAYIRGAIAPLRDVLDPTDAAGAYEVQAINTRFWEGQGRRIVGRKIGLTSKAVQAQLGVDQPDFGVLFEDMEIPDGGTLTPSRALQPKAEAEIAFVLSRDITDENATSRTVEKSIDCAIAAIEIVDSRIQDWKITFADTVADNGSSAFFVLGKERKSLSGLDLYTCGMALEVDGDVASVGSGAACLGHPLIATAWLARTLASLGDPLRAGDIVLTGALGPMVALAVGQKVEAKIGGIGTANFRYIEGGE